MASGCASRPIKGICNRDTRLGGGGRVEKTHAHTPRSHFDQLFVMLELRVFKREELDSRAIVWGVTTSPSGNSAAPISKRINFKSRKKPFFKKGGGT